ncbi:MAG: hypothetical protein ABGX51_01755 [Gammaproteobacteria bacterium]|jgi:antitoxin component YwqK of YwqJK toxin-antitoxin module
MKKLLLISALLFSVNINAQDLPPNGKFIVHHKNGETYLTGEVKNNKKHGTWEFFYENGQLQAREKYNEGRPVGVWKTFSTNGSLKEKNDLRNINQGDLNSRGSPYTGGPPGVK